MTLAYYLHDLSPHLIKITDRVAVHWYGLAYVLGFYLTYRVMLFLAKRKLSEIKPEAVADFITMVALFGVVLGGRLGYMLLYNFDEFIHRPWIFFLLNQGGMASHGGIAGVALYCLWYARKHKISWTGIGDTLVCGAPLGIFLGRIANFINGELFGRVTNVSWAMKFPTEITHQDFVAQGGSAQLQQDVYQMGLQHSPEIIRFFEQNRGGRAELETILHPRHPSQLYEALGEGLLLSALLLLIRVKFPKLPHGIVTGLFFILYAVARISLEFVRQPDSGSELIMGLTKGQFFSTFMIVTGLAFIAYGWFFGKRPQETVGA
ncbi:MAG: prolipoprotein diacylglyceryl transferase [Prosthecobacter sp.]|jgi:phosphatidylglycerol:prolipoprotein diacylglycerol transferase|uniref:prolipoprotein diacylglyceryl transferase n=1 Tax=Prosthecobacter sp. TaxID=1965333 RepID=UPI0019F812FA|nr:prolipoprotein diacylglyceryl transferase [Prosthecobacter sp.]MBE2285666.1 prolipoprotein diacylglyceryl transferase [Prosthecobacter sp.]